jgi:hypothetical protein
VNPIVLDRWFRVWRYGIGHSQLVFHARAGSGDPEHVNVLFEDVRAVKLRSAYRPLVLQPVDEPTRAQLLGFAGLPARHQARMLCLGLSDQGAESGFVVCGKATVLAVPKEPDGEKVHPLTVWPEHARPIYCLTQPR